MKRNFRKPLVIMTPKSMLRSEQASSKSADFTSGHFREILPAPPFEKNENIKRVIFCSGKVYYDLLNFREAEQKRDAAIVRVEQIYPMNFDLLSKETGSFPADAKWVWCQEEPQNMGAWNHILPVLGNFGKRYIHYAGRDASSSPAVGSLALHKREQAQLVRDAFSVQ
jgi:2-oxoglutarate dehydrogenase E1 component